jgi:PAS domain S-box-containing protein
MLNECPGPDAVSRIHNVLMRHYGGLSITEIATETGMNRMSVAKYLEVLVALESIAAERRGRAKIYTCTDRRVPAAVFRKHMPLHYAITDSDLKVLELNDYVPRTVGEVGVRLPDMFREHVANYDECMVAFRDAVAGTPATVIAERLFPGGSEFCELRCMPIRFPDGAPGMMSLSVDITRERRAIIAGQAEAERFRGIVESLPYPVFLAGADGTLSYVSPRAAEFGLAPGRLAGRPFADLAVPRDRMVMDAGFSDVRESGKGTIRFRVSVKGRRNVRLEAVCTAQQDATGACIGVTGRLREVPEGDRPARKRVPGREG